MIALRNAALYSFNLVNENSTNESATVAHECRSNKLTNAWVVDRPLKRIELAAVNRCFDNIQYPFANKRLEQLAKSRISALDQTAMILVD